jgi:hypothetical protein
MRWQLCTGDRTGLLRSSLQALMLITSPLGCLNPRCEVDLATVPLHTQYKIVQRTSYVLEIAVNTYRALADCQALL